MAYQTIYLKRSGELDSGSPKAPDAKDMQYGELYVNYSEGNETLFIKNSNNEVASVRIPTVQETADSLAEHVADTDNPHQVTKAQVGLGNVDNTSDNDKPVSAAQQAALDLKVDSSDIVDNLTTNDSEKPLSAEQGVVLYNQLSSVIGSNTDLADLTARVVALEEEVDGVLDYEDEIIAREDEVYAEVE